MLPSCESLFKKFNSEICYCHWKSNEHLLAGLHGDTDLDILVSSEDSEKCSSILYNCGFRKAISQYGSRFACVEDWICCDELSGKIIHIHLHYKIITGHKGLKEYVLPWTALALSTRMLDEKTNVYVIDPNLEIIILYARIGLKTTFAKRKKAKKCERALSESDIKEIEYLKATIDYNIVEKIIKSTLNNNGVFLLNCIKSDNYNYDNYLNIIKSVRKLRQKSNRLTFIGRIFLPFFYDFSIKFRWFLKIKFGKPIITRKTLTQPGKAIVFIGQDGAGKSTVTKEIDSWLNYKLDAKRFYLGSGEHYSSWQKRKRLKLQNNSDKISKFRYKVLTLFDLLKCAKYGYKVVKCAKKYVDKGGVAIFDRFPQLQFSGINDGPKIRFSVSKEKHNSFINLVLLSFAKKEEKYIKKTIKILTPDLVFKLILPPEVSIQRKPNEFIEDVRKKSAIIEKLEFNESDVHKIDANQDYEKELLLLKSLIWNTIKGV